VLKATPPASGENATTAARWAEELLKDYRAGDFFFASPHRMLLASGVRATVGGADGGQGAPERLAAAALARVADADGGNPIVVGAVPFDHGAPAHLVIPERVRRLAPEWVRPAGPVPTRPAGGPGTGAPLRAPGWQVQPVPAPERYESGVSATLEKLRSGELEKVVLARSLRLTAPEPIDVRAVLLSLLGRDSSGYTFAVDLPPRADTPSRPGGRTLVGASPELLVARAGSQVTANPMAGSAARHADPAEDRRRAAALLSSLKDRREHALVVDAVHATLRPYCAKLTVPDTPSVVRTPTMWHLATRITGEVSDPSISALRLARALHPTPAVCGEPRAAAREVIGELEPFDRGFYAGTLGWGDARGDGEWIVTIRCGEISERSLRLFAGAGIVAGSRPADELAETTAKFRTLLLAMGLDEAG
jgi:isochorismate synthase